VGPADLAPLFPMELIKQEVSTERTIEIPKEVRDLLKMWRPSPLYRATHLEKLQKAVIEAGADCGIALDGDADRCLAVDAKGMDVDGDQIMAILSLAMRERGVLAHDTLVATVMSNLGMLQALEREGVAVRQTAVGDRYVLEEMKAGAFSLGGEQSGHVIFLDHGTTGDGTMTGLMLVSRLAQTGRSLEDLAAVMKRLPQVLINVRGVDKSRVEDDEAVQTAVVAAQAELEGVGRVLLRKSGTEPLVRVMVEASDEASAQTVAERLAAVVAKNLQL